MKKKKWICGIMLIGLMALMVACGDESRDVVQDLIKNAHNENYTNNTSYDGELEAENSVEDNKEDVIRDEKNDVLMTSYFYDNNGNLSSYTVNEYDVNDNLVKTSTYYANGSLSFYGICEYDDNGKLQKKVYYNNLDGNILAEEKYEYNGKGRLCKKAWFDNEKSLYYYIYEYDENNDHIKTSGYDADVSYYGNEAYEYDESINVARELVHTGSDRICYHNTYEYDNNDMLVRKNMYGMGGELSVYGIYEYDKNGNLIKYSEFDDDGTSRGYETYKFDEDGTPVEYSEYDKYGERKFYNEYEYGKNDNPVEIEYTDVEEKEFEQEEEIVEVNKQVAQLYYVDILDGGLMYKITYDIEYNADIVQHTREAIGTSMNSVCSIVRFAGEKVGDRYFYSGIESFDGDLQKEAQRLMNQTIYDSRKILAEGEMTVSGYDGYYYETECIYGEDKYSDYYGVVQIDEGRYFYIYGACLDDIWSRNMTSQEFMEAALISAKFVSREQTDSWH